MKRFTSFVLLVGALSFSGLHAQKPEKPQGKIEPVNVCAPVFNPVSAFLVPGDRILVIEDASVSAAVDPGERVVALLETTVGDTSAKHYVGTVSGSEFLFERDGRRMNVYADPDSYVVLMAAKRNFPENIEICFSGRLEPVGQ
jgi:hypothetical protein